MPQWQKIGVVDALGHDARGIFFVGDTEVAVFKTKKGLFGCENACPHKGFPLIKGEMEEGPLIICPWHKITFNMITGCLLAGGLRLKTYEVEEREAGLFIRPCQND